MDKQVLVRGREIEAEILECEYNVLKLKEMLNPLNPANDDGDVITISAFVNNINSNFRTHVKLLKPEEIVKSQIELNKQRIEELTKEFRAL